MNLTRAEKCIIALTLLFLTFTLGVHVGLRQAGSSVTVSSGLVEETTTAETEESAEPPAAVASASPEPTATPSILESGGKINLNTATAEELCELNGIGEVLAQRIIDYREENGDFERIEDITKVSGIGSGIYAKICDYISV